jgi:hypothetical protein
MNNTQRWLVVAALVVIGVVLAFLMLEWDDGWRFNLTRVLIFYEAQDPRYSNLIDHWGIYTRYGLAGILLGVVAPLCLFAVAGFIALGARRS